MSRPSVHVIRPKPSIELLNPDGYQAKYTAAEARHLLSELATALHEIEPKAAADWDSGPKIISGRVSISAYVMGKDFERALDYELAGLRREILNEARLAGVMPRSSHACSPSCPCRARP